MCLVMLSMDKLSTEEARKLVFFKDGLEAEAHMEKNRYRCEVCEKVLKNHALGGHRAKTTHQKKMKKAKICLEQEEQNTSVAADDDDHEEEKYKRFHFGSYLQNSHNKSSTESDEKKFLDLNFPAMDEDEGLLFRHTTQINQLHQG